MNCRFVAFIAFASFLILLTPWLLTRVSEQSPYYTSWDFHECFVETLDARYCSNELIKYSEGYDYYPPVTHLLAGLLPFPPKQALQFLLVASFFALIALMAVGTNSFIAGLAFFFVAHDLWSSYFLGGTVPFFLFLVYVLVAAFYWDRLSRLSKLALCLLALFTHVYGGWFFLAFALFLEVLPRRVALNLGFWVAMAIAVTLSAGTAHEFRGLMLVIVFVALFLGEALAGLESKRFILRRKGNTARGLLEFLEAFAPFVFVVGCLALGFVLVSMAICNPLFVAFALALVVLSTLIACCLGFVALAVVIKKAREKRK